MERTLSYDHALFDGGGLIPPPGRLRKVLVVGAGVAGLQTARQLTKLGAQVLVLESNAEVGGVWIRNYIGFGLQVPWRMYQFPEFPWPKHLQPSSEYPTGQEVQEYVRAYCQEYDLRRYIRFNCKLLRLRWCAASRQWDALYCDTCQEKFFKVTVDYAVICAGIYSQPYIPDYEGTDGYAGIQLHAKDFVDLSLARGRRVVIVGAGKTALDCVSSIVATNTATSVTLLYRQAHWPLPRRMLWTSIRRLLFNRAMTAMMPPYYTASTAATAASKAALPLRKLFWRGMESAITRKFRITEQMRPRVHLPADLFYGGQILDNTMDKLVRSEALLTIKGEINRFVRNGVILQDGSFVAADLVLYCTGYLKTYDYLEGDMRARLDLQKDGLYLYRNCLPYAVPHLAFIGSEVSTYNNILTHGLQALWLAHVLSGRVPLPTPVSMAEDVRAQQRWRRAVMPAQRSRGSVLMLYMMQYHDQLLADMGHAPHRKGLNLFAECFGAYTAEDYQELLESDDVVLASSRSARQQLAAAAAAAAAGIPPSVLAAAASGRSGLLVPNAPSPLVPSPLAVTAIAAEASARMSGGGGGGDGAVTSGEMCTSPLLYHRTRRRGSGTGASISVRSNSGQDAPYGDNIAAAAAATAAAATAAEALPGGGGGSSSSASSSATATGAGMAAHGSGMGCRCGLQAETGPLAAQGHKRGCSQRGSRGVTARSRSTSTRRISHLDGDPDSVEGLGMLGQRAASARGTGSGCSGYGGGGNCCSCGVVATAACVPAAHLPAWALATEHARESAADLAMVSPCRNGAVGVGGCYSSGPSAWREATTTSTLPSACAAAAFRNGPRAAADFPDGLAAPQRGAGARNLLFPAEAPQRPNSCSAAATRSVAAGSSSSGGGGHVLASGSSGLAIGSGSGSGGIAAAAASHRSFSARSTRESAGSAVVPSLALGATGSSAAAAATAAQVAAPAPCPAGPTHPSSPSRLSRFSGGLTSPTPGGRHSALGHPANLASPTGRTHQGDVRSPQVRQQHPNVFLAYQLQQQHIQQQQQQHSRWSLRSNGEAMAATAVTVTAAAAAAEEERETISGVSGSGSGSGSSGGGGGDDGGRTKKVGLNSATANITSAAVAAADGGGGSGGSGNISSSALLYDSSSGAVISGGGAFPAASWEPPPTRRRSPQYDSSHNPQPHDIDPRHYEKQQYGGGCSVVVVGGNSKEPPPPTALALAIRSDRPTGRQQDSYVPAGPEAGLPVPEGPGGLPPKRRLNLGEGGRALGAGGTYVADGSGSYPGQYGDQKLQEYEHQEALGGSRARVYDGGDTCMCVGRPAATAAAGMAAGGGCGCVAASYRCDTTVRMATANGQSLHATVATANRLICKDCNNGNNGSVAFGSDRSERSTPSSSSQSCRSEDSNGSCNGCSSGGDGDGNTDLVGGGGGAAAAAAAAAAAVAVDEADPNTGNENGNAIVAVADGKFQTQPPVPPLEFAAAAAANPVHGHGPVSEHRYPACGSLGGGSDALYGSPGSSAVSLSLWHTHSATGSGGGLVRQSYGAGARVGSPAELRFSAMGRLGPELGLGVIAGCDDAEQRPVNARTQARRRTDGPATILTTVAAATATASAGGSLLLRASSSNSASKPLLRSGATGGGIFPVGVTVGSGGPRALRRTGSSVRSGEGTAVMLAAEGGRPSGSGSCWQLLPGGFSTGVQSTGSSGGGHLCSSISLAGGIPPTAAAGSYSSVTAQPDLLVRQPSRLSSCATGDSANGANLADTSPFSSPPGGSYSPVPAKENP